MQAKQLSLVWLLLLVLMLTGSLVLSGQGPKEETLRMAFDPDKYTWGTPPPVLWVTEIMPHGKYTVDDINTTTILLEGRHKPIKVEILRSKGVVRASYDGSTIEAEIGIKMAHLKIPFVGRVHNFFFGGRLEYTDGTRGQLKGSVIVRFEF